MTDPVSSSSILLADTSNGPQSMLVHAEYFEGQIDVKKFRAMFPHYRVLASDPLVIEPEEGRFIALTKFGGVAFWNCTKILIQGILDEIRQVPGTLARKEKVTDDVTVIVGAEKERVSFEEVCVTALTVEKMKLISLAVAQSVALELFEEEVSAALLRMQPFVHQLRDQGTLRITENEVLRAVGFALEVRGAVLANLTLFDDPPETWESEALAHLDSQLYDHFDLEERLAAINQKVAFLSDFNAMLMDLLNVRKSHRLEWYIIILILVEIVMFLGMEFAPLFGGE